MCPAAAHHAQRRESPHLTIAVWGTPADRPVLRLEALPQQRQLPGARLSRPHEPSFARALYMEVRLTPSTCPICSTVSSESSYILRACRRCSADSFDGRPPTAFLQKPYFSSHCLPYGHTPRPTYHSHLTTCRCVNSLPSTPSFT